MFLKLSNHAIHLTPYTLFSQLQVTIAKLSRYNLWISEHLLLSKVPRQIWQSEPQKRIGCRHLFMFMFANLK